ncbi:MAG: TIGR03084 family metal-binding protein [Acidimicrobiia bacterium]|nr:TIGR03084 family metal-binding protein [Acidimicrobiia bacterium]
MAHGSGQGTGHGAVTAASVRQDLVDEQAELDEIMVILDPTAWEFDTPSPGWRIRDQIGHLAYFDDTAALAITSTEDFIASRTRLVAALADADAADELTLAAARSMTAGELLDHWRACRQRLADASQGLADDTRVEWYGPSMGSKSFLTARLMECWAHGQDIVDTLGIVRRPTDRLAHIAKLGYITRPWTYLNRGLEVPAGEVRVELTSPGGEQWVYGPKDSEATVTGTALDFCLVTSQRRHLDDTGLELDGDLARDWLVKAQLFAGPPSDPPEPQPRTT